MSTYTQGLIIDGIMYDIPMVEIKRTFDFLEKYAKRTEDGEIHLETIGGFQNYSIKIGTINDPDTYDKLYNHITDAKNRFHTVVLPDSKSSFTFDGYFSSISDKISKILSDKVVYSDLTWKMTERIPTKKA